MDERTLGQAEFTVMSLRNEPNVTVIGENSADMQKEIGKRNMRDILSGFGNTVLFYLLN